MKFLEAHIYQSRQGSSCLRVFGLASTAGLTNCLWIASSKAPSTPFCHCLLTNARRLPLPDTCLLPTFCSLLSDGLLCILAWLATSCLICAAAGSPASHRVIYRAHSYDLCPTCQMPFSLFSFELGLLCTRKLCSVFFLWILWMEGTRFCFKLQWCCEVSHWNKLTLKSTVN